MTFTYIDTPYSDANPAPPIHDESCTEWHCSHCALCGEWVLYGARCGEHYGVYPQPTDPSPEVTLRCGDSRPHARHEWQMSSTGGAECLGVPGSTEPQDHVSGSRQIHSDSGSTDRGSADG